VAAIGNTVLEVSRIGRVPHASVCGGRGRCTTCRVRIVSSDRALPAASAEETAVLRRIGATRDIRLACQLRPTGNLAVTPLLPAGIGVRGGAAVPDYLQGDEREICVLFADLRGFTRFAERRLPYDVVFFLNRYFETMGSAIERAGGITNQFTGDGVMALFGVDSGPEKGCRAAVDAALAMSRGLAEMSVGLAEELDESLRMGIGIHSGPAVVGRMGRGVAMYLTAVGDTVQVASRLQDLTKEYECQLVISELAASRAGIDVTGFERYEITVRNRAEPVAIRTVADLEALVAAPVASG
jgi:adenylate cyclase